MSTLNEAILEWMQRHGIERGEDCPILKVSLVGFAEDGTPMVKVRAAYDVEIASATGKGNGE